MHDKKSSLILNMDLDDDFFEEVIIHINDISKNFNSSVTLSDFPKKTELNSKFNLIITFNRKIDAGISSVSPGLASLRRIEEILESKQMKSCFKKLLLVDCGEMPNAGLSDWGVIGQYFEAVNDLFPTIPFAGVYALDGERGPSGEWRDGALKWWDTQSDEFIDHMRDQLIATLQLFSPS